ncbi:MAG: hypothetical protein KF749_07505 [Bacteroidetes bacterium]|nr:hypothetical protein [Bacteroidota bacterium]MCW5896831.1 hypothetical protein [Bacteroidota bacterium]
MPSKQSAVDWVNDPTRSAEELRRACRLMDLPDGGDGDALRSRLNDALTNVAPSEEVVCLNPVPIDSKR